MLMWLFSRAPLLPGPGLWEEEETPFGLDRDGEGGEGYSGLIGSNTQYMGY